MIINEANFWEFVRVGEPDQCWPWLGTSWAGKKTHRYGVFWDGRWMLYAHRFAYTLKVGPIPAGLEILHGCDNTRCCNPKHMKPGTRSENMQDMIAKGRGRWARGEASGKSKIDSATALAIYQDQRIYAATAAAFGVSYTCVADIKRGRTWSHVTGKRAA